MKPWNIAHRGGARLKPENTLAAFRDAMARGCDGAELDLQLAQGGEVVVHHDFHLMPAFCRGADGHWLRSAPPLIKDLDVRDLKRYDIGRADPASRYAHDHAGVAWQDGLRIPTLSEVVDAVKDSAMRFRLFAELKTCFSNRAVSASPEALAMHALQVIYARDFLVNTVFVSFDWPGLLHIKRLEPRAEVWFTTMPLSWFGETPPPPGDDPPGEHALDVLRRWAQEGHSPWAAGFDAVRHGGSILKAIHQAGADGWFAYHRDITAERMAEAQSLKLDVGAWTVNEPAEMRALAKLGVDAICTDRPDLMAGVTKELRRR
jgi:glycerophosphoryl diester phosphodiesterase